MSNRNKDYQNHNNNNNHSTKLKDFYTFNTTKSNINPENQELQLPPENKTNYSLITFLNSKRKPDIYYGNTFLSGMHYNNKKQEQEKLTNTDNDNKDLIEKEEEEEDNNNNNSSDHNEGKYQDMKNTNVRYYNFSQNITIKCFNCGEIGHMSRSCPHEQVVFCIRCNRIGHEDRACPITKCFKCNQYGHRSNNCPLTKKDLIVCERCEHIGHKGYDCLINPLKVDIQMLKYHNATCYFCGSHKHVLCTFNKMKSPISLISPLYNSNKAVIKNNDNDNDNEVLNEEGEIDEDKRIFKSITNDEISNCPFCPRCGRKHKMKYCKIEDRKNEFDERRLQYSNYIFGKKHYK